MVKQKLNKISSTEELEEVVQTLLSHVGVDGEVNGVKDEEGAIQLSVSTPTPALVIGYHGKTLDALSVVASAIAYKKLGEQVRVIVDVDEWRAKREEKLTSLAQNIASRVRTTGQEEPIYNLTPLERRVVHVALGEIDGVETESRGEGKDRYLVVKPVEKGHVTSDK